MIIYFEDSSITNEPLYSITDKEMIKVDAKNGITSNINQLIAIEKDRDFDTSIYTNSIVALWSRWCWDKENKIPQLYIRNINGEWENITHFTTRELREGHNLAKLYISGEFDVYNKYN